MDRSERLALCDVALDAAGAAGARYVEARWVRRTRENLGYKDGALDLSYLQGDVGIGVRALVGDSWGYGATNVLTPDGVARAAQDAARIAADSGGGDVEVQLPAAASGEYTTPVCEDPFEVPLRDKSAIFEAAHRRILEAGAGIRGARGALIAHAHETTLRASNGSSQHQRVVITGGCVSAIAEHGGDVQVRSLPKALEGNIVQGGFEHVRAMALDDAARVAAEEAIALSRAELTPAGKRTLILHPSQLSLQIHESVGHPTELDRVLGEEISLAGASFLLPDQLDRLQFGSERVNLTADATTPLGPGTFGFDDEGTPATATPLVRAGRFVGYLSGRDSAARLGRPSGSAARAESWARLPIVRMVNVNLEPGEGTLEDLVAGVDDGLLLASNKSWSIDDLRLNFQFSCEIAYEIKRGRRTGRIFKNPLYVGVTPSFWRSCSGIAGPEAWGMWGWLHCGKGDPGQLMYVGHGCAPARFEGVDVRAS